MKRNFIILIILLIIPVVLLSQSKGDLRIGTYGQVTVFDNNLISQYGVCGELFIAENFSLNYKYGLGSNINGDIIGHINPAIFLVPFAISYPAAILGVLLISEGVSYHIQVSEFVEIAPYISPLGAEINLYEDQEIVLSCATGFNFYFKHFSPVDQLLLSFNGGATIIYKDMNVMPTVGVSLMYSF